MRLLLPIVLALGLASVPVHAGPVMFVHDQDARLGLVDVATGNVRIIGSMPVLITDIAIDASGRLFGIGFNGFYEIDPLTAAVTFIGNHGIEYANALTVGPDGMLYAAAALSTFLYRIDPSTGIATNLGSTGFPSGGDLAFHEGSLYLAATSGRLVRVDPANPAASALVGSMGAIEVFGLSGGGDGVLYASAWTTIYRVDTGSGTATHGVDYGGRGLFAAYGLAFLPCAIAPAVSVTTFAAGGGTGVATFQAPAACTWDVSSSASWLAPLPETIGSGSGTIRFRVAANTTGAARSATLRIGTATFTITQTATPAVRGDLDANGSADLVWQHSDGRLAVWYMSGATQIAGRAFAPPALSDPAWSAAARGDFDRDGSGDVLFQHADGRLAVWLMSGATLLSGRALTPASVADPLWRVQAADDFDRDGWLDLIWRHETTGAVAVWYMTGTVLREGRLLTPAAVPDLDWLIAGAGDMNGDGHADLVWQHRVSGGLAVWLMRGDHLMSGEPLTPNRVADTDWRIRAVADYNGDGWPDLAWQHRTEGMLSIWIMRATMLVDGLRVSPFVVSDAGWRIVR